MNWSLGCRLMLVEYTNRCGPLMYPNSSYRRNYLLTTLFIVKLFQKNGKSWCYKRNEQYLPHRWTATNAIETHAIARRITFQDIDALSELVQDLVRPTCRTGSVTDTARSWTMTTEPVQGSDRCRVYFRPIT